ncbi:unnamed protein product [Prorocentrum cordatum]|uniref:Uncharacterized protein n=1 Tax=Prorocentrum cordatum TaxID=2364126 RepID=A0ABN9W642_9DINO|nr:unnamed protein product [Polarella glacialis]
MHAHPGPRLALARTAAHALHGWAGRRDDDDGGGGGGGGGREEGRRGARSVEDPRTPAARGSIRGRRAPHACRRRAAGRPSSAAPPGGGSSDLGGLRRIPEAPQLLTTAECGPSSSSSSSDSLSAAEAMALSNSRCRGSFSSGREKKTPSESGLQGATGRNQSGPNLPMVCDRFVKQL